ncbi:unnamed protein product [Amoebophrya sp. A25]|nr:unnamed protein product [Amoebophrya sp. A25]|eukprot:GSA25T00026660001.1
MASSDVAVGTKSCSWRLPQTRSRALVSLPRNRFLTASYVPGGGNQIHTLSFQEEQNELTVASSLDFEHGPVSCLSFGAKSNAACAVSRDSFFVWKVEEGEAGQQAGPTSATFFQGLQQITTSTPASASSSGGKKQAATSSWYPKVLHHCEWDPFESSRVALTARDGVEVWDVVNEKEVVFLYDFPSSSGGGSGADCTASPSVVHATAFDTHHSSTLALGVNADLMLWDFRDVGKPTSSASGSGGVQKPKASLTRKDAHLFGLTALSYNPNLPGQLLTAGEDGCWKQWDLRKMQAACVIHTPSGHSHWVTRISHNSYHDQLLLSAGSDSQLRLWRVSSKPANIVKTLSTFTAEDAIYSAAWSLSDPWTFACLSYDGEVSVHQVPMEEKYRILL